MIDESDVEVEELKVTYQFNISCLNLDEILDEFKSNNKSTIFGIQQISVFEYLLITKLKSQIKNVFATRFNEIVLK